jgi:hypothetical protein
MGLSLIPFPPISTSQVSSNNEQIPLYTADGSSQGFRSIDVARRLVSGGLAKPSYGRKGHLKAIWLLQDDGGNPVESHARSASRYSFPQRLDSGYRCWKHKRLDAQDDDGTRVSTRGVFFQVIKECLIT